MSQAFSFRKVYGAPCILAAITAYGLLSALLGDGLWDELSWIALAIPLVVIARKYVMSHRYPSRKV
jgi:hypothetical protein